ncbi:MAG: hypothetical protein DLM52_10085 [Chthoniobacterales bacterium]|nr:MAG: hypothetical protein DLM52_10085 [Chthoniobacterales bacterium]
MKDLRFALRMLAKQPGFTAVALLTLALCLGANLTIFAVIDAVLLRRLPFPQPEQLVSLYNTYPKAGVENDGASIANYYERRGNIPAFSSLSIYSDTNAVIGEPGATNPEETMRISPEFFATLGVAPALGRAFTEDETTHEGNHVVIITDAFWQTHFNRDPHVLGREVRANQIQRKIVGVLSPDFRFLSSEPQLFLPLTPEPEQRLSTQRHSGGGGTRMIARLRLGATLSEAQAQIDAQNGALEKENPEAKMMAEAGFRSLVLPLHREHVRAIRPTLLLLQPARFSCS